MLDPKLLEPPERAETEVVADLAQKYLDRHQPGDYRLVVNRRAVVRGTHRWIVQVDVDPADMEVNGSDVSDRMTAADIELDRDFPRYIFLSPLVPQPGEVL